MVEGRVHAVVAQQVAHALRLVLGVAVDDRAARRAWLGLGLGVGLRLGLGLGSGLGARVGVGLGLGMG